MHRLELVPPAAGARATTRVRSSTSPCSPSDRMLLTVEEAADGLGIGRSTMYTLMANGEVASIHLGRLRRIEPAELTAYIARQRDHRTSAELPHRT